MENFGLYLVMTDPVVGYERCCEAAVRAGVRMVQLRMKDRPREEIVAVGKALRRITAGSRTNLIINDDPSIAAEVGADGVHVGQGDMPVAEVRRRYPSLRIVGLSTHNPDQARAAIDQKPDYIGVGPVFATPTKKIPDPTLGVETAARMIASVPFPAVAIGGLNLETLPSVLAAGARNFAVVRAVCGAADPEAAIRAIQALASPEAVIELRDVRKTFRDFWLRPTVKAVDGLSLTVRKGEVFGLLGPNGSGKSTTIKMILGLLSPSGGTVSLFGQPPQTVAARRRLGYLPELSYLHPFLTAQETLAYYAGLSGLARAVARTRTRELLDMVGLSDVANRPVGGFSKGMARRLALAAALIGKPDLLVLDEPTSGLDPISTKEVKLLVKALRAGGMTVLTTSHLLADAQDICDRVMIVNHGKCVAEGRVADLGTSLEEFFLAKVDDAKDFTLAPFLAH